MGYMAEWPPFRARGLRVVIFVNDHQPAHLHVFGDGEAKINLFGADGTPELVWVDGMTRGEAPPCRAHRYRCSRPCCWPDGRTFMAELTDAEIDAATERGKAARRDEPRAATARYDRHPGRVIVELTNGCTFAFPPRLAQGLDA